MRQNRISKRVYTVCMAAALLLAAGVFLGVALSQRAETARYTSVHSAATLPPMMGFSPDSLLNTGDAEELDKLPGVGEVIAQRIIEVRNQINGFRIPEDLLLVRGIGEITLDKLLNALPDALIPLEPINRYGTNAD